VPFNEEDILNTILSLGLQLSDKLIVSDALNYVHFTFGDLGIEKVRELVTQIEETKASQSEGITARDYALKKADVLEWDTTGISPLMQTTGLIKDLQKRLRGFLNLPSNSWSGYTPVMRLP
jgi:hypothetical protein